MQQPHPPTSNTPKIPASQRSTEDPEDGGGGGRRRRRHGRGWGGGSGASSYPRAGRVVSSDVDSPDVDASGTGKTSRQPGQRISSPAMSSSASNAIPHTGHLNLIVIPHLESHYVTRNPLSNSATHGPSVARL